MKRLMCFITLVFGLNASAATPSTAAKLTLTPSYAGAVLQGRIYSPSNDAIVGVWSGAGFSRLLKCAPRCTVVKSIPLKNTLLVGSDSGYRVALGGKFTVGQKVNITLRFQNQGVLITQAIVTKP